MVKDTTFGIWATRPAVSLDADDDAGRMSRLPPRAAAGRSARDYRPSRLGARLHAAIPLITPDPPWLSDVPVVFDIMMLLIIIIELSHRIRT